VSTVELVHTHDDMMTPARNITSICNCSMDRLGRESILHWFRSALPLLTIWQLNNRNKLYITNTSLMFSELQCDNKNIQLQNKEIPTTVKLYYKFHKQHSTYELQEGTNVL
jgi:hypothetical protein